MSSGSIPLHPDKGVNPALCYCPVCGADSNSIALMGNHKVYDCVQCGMRHYGYPKNRACIQCHANVSKGRELEPGEKVPGATCDECTKKLETTNLLVCIHCRKIYTVEAHRCLKAFNPTDMTIAEAVDKGYLEVVVGNVIREPCEECHAAQKDEENAG